MSLQNRVLPTGEITRAPWRGAMMGNRGCLHRPDRTLGVARWRHANWVCCVTEFRGRHRLPMPPPGSPTVWTALFFWDEASAFAAGHRPCGECRNADYRRFRRLWEEAGLPAGGAGAIDKALHAARVTRDRRHVSHMAEAGSLPDGVFLRLDGVPGLLARGAFHPWREAGGYGPPAPGPRGEVEVLTPAPVVTVFRAGFVPAMRLVGHIGH